MDNASKPKGNEKPENQDETPDTTSDTSFENVEWKESKEIDPIIDLPDGMHPTNENPDPKHSDTQTTSDPEDQSTESNDNVSLPRLSPELEIALLGITDEDTIQLLVKADAALVKGNISNTLSIGIREGIFRRK